MLLCLWGGCWGEPIGGLAGGLTPGLDFAYRVNDRPARASGLRTCCSGPLYHTAAPSAPRRQRAAARGLAVSSEGVDIGW